MTDTLAPQRRFFAEEIQVTCNLRTPALLDALATVPREQFLPAGPWLIQGEGDFGGGPRPTPDADPRHVYHNVAIALDPARQLFNGMPSVVVRCLDALALRPGARVLHVGCGAGYYTALAAHLVGPSGRILAIDIDKRLAAQARAHLASLPWAEAREGDGLDLRGETFDAILVNAGVTHPHAAWLDALAPAGRIVLPLTVAMEQMGPIGKGVIVVLTNDRDGSELSARVVTLVAIYSAVGIRDAAMNQRLRDALKRAPWPSIKRLRRDRHDVEPSCWLHGEGFCLTTA